MPRQKYQQELLTVEMAIYHACMDYEHGGLQGMANQLGISYDVLRKKISPRTTSHTTQASELVKIIHLSRDPRLLDSINYEAEAVWYFDNDVKELPADLDVLQSNNDLMKSCVELIDELVSALDDGQIDKDERKKIDQKFINLSKKMKIVDVTASRFEVRND